MDTDDDLIAALSEPYDPTSSIRREIEQGARALKAANKRRETAMGNLTAAVRSAAELGVPETQLSKLAGVDRMTVRRMLGKRKDG